jgi:hypothetical protein
MRTTCDTCTPSRRAGLMRCRDCGRTLPDRYGRIWEIPDVEKCPECGQPDSVGDCTHQPLTDGEARLLGWERRP